jgi:hypothetical protein
MLLHRLQICSSLPSLSCILTYTACFCAEMTHNHSLQLQKTLDPWHQICCFAPKICARWRYTGTSSSTIRTTGGSKSQSQIATYHETTHCGIWLRSIPTLRISLRLSASVISLWIHMVTAAVSSPNWHISNLSCGEVMSRSVGNGLVVFLQLLAKWVFLELLSVAVMAHRVVSGRI